jgi:hypothetical protein
MANVVLDDIVYIFPNTTLELTKGRYYCVVYSYDDRCIYSVTITKKRKKPVTKYPKMTLEYDGSWWLFQLKPFSLKGLGTSEAEVEDAMERNQKRAKKKGYKAEWTPSADWLKFINAKVHAWQYTHDTDRSDSDTLTKCNAPLPARQFSCEMKHRHEYSCRRDYVTPSGAPCDDATDDTCLPQCYWDVQQRKCQDLGDDRDRLAVKNLQDGAVQDAHGRVTWNQDTSGIADLLDELDPDGEKKEADVADVPDAPTRRLPLPRLESVDKYRKVKSDARPTPLPTNTSSNDAFDDLMAELDG